MNKIYLVDGKPYEVAPHREKEFLSTMESQGKTPVLQEQGNQQSSAEDATVEQTTTASTPEVDQPQQTQDTELTSEDTSSELPEDKQPLSMWQRLSKAFDDGVKDTDNIKARRELFEKGVDTSDETIQQLIAEHQRLANTEPSEGMKKFMEVYNKEYDERIKEDPESSPGFWSFVQAFKEQPGVGSEVFVRSMASQLAALRDDDIRQKTELAAVTAGTGALALGQAGPQIAIPEELITVPSAMYVAGMGTLTYQMETANSAVEFLLEELEEGEDFTLENARKILENPEKAQRIKNRARARGATIGTFEALAGLIAPGVTKAARGFRKTGQAVAGISTEAVLGGAGEVAGRIAADQDMDPVDVGFETIAGTTTAPFTVAPALIGDIKNRPAYSFKDKDGNVEVVSKKEMQKFLDTATDEELSMANLKIDNDVDLANIAAEKVNNAVLESQVNERVTDKSDRVKLVDLEKKRVKAEIDAKKKGISQVPNAKENLEAIESQMTEIVDKYAKVDRRTKPVRDIKKRAKDVRESRLTETIKFAEEQGKVIGKETIAVNNNKEAQEVFNRAREEYNAKNPDDLIEEADVSNADGFVVGNTIVINKDVAGKTGQINVGAHELLHAVVAKHIRSLSDGQRTQLITDFKNTLTNEQFNYIKNKIEARGDLDIDSTEEWLNIMSDGITKGEISFNESVFDKIKNFIQEIARKIGYRKEFQNGRQVYNFMKDYQASIKKNKLSERAIKLAEEGAPVTETKFSVEASERVQKAYDDMGEAAAMDIIDEFKPIVTKQARRFRDVPGYSEEDIISEIEIGKRGIFDLIREYKPESGVPLAAYINKFLPVRANEAAGRILGEQFTDDVTEAKAVTATETAEDTMVADTKPKRKGIVLADRLKVKDQITPIAEKYVKDNDLTGTTYKKTPNIATDIVGNLMGIPAKKIVSNANLSKPELANAQMFINKNADMLQSMLPEGATEDGTATGVQKVLLDKFYNKRSKRAKTKAGLATQSKRPDITRSEFLEVFGIIDGKPQRDDRNTSSRVLALAKQLDRAMSNQAVREVLMQDDTQAATVQQMASGKSPVMFSKTPAELKEMAELPPNKILSKNNKENPVSYIKTVYRSSKSGKEKSRNLADFNKEIRVSGVLSTLGKQTTDIITSFLTENPQFTYDLRKTMSGGQGLSFFGLTSVFDELSNNIKIGEPTSKRHKYSGTGRLLDSKKHIKKGKKVSIKDGKDFVTGKQFAKTQSEKHNNLEDLFVAIQKYLKKKPEHSWLFARMVADTVNNQDSIVRISAPLVGLPIDTKGNLIYNQKIAEEHSFPQNQVGTMLLDAAIAGDNIKEVMKIVRSSYSQIALLETDDVKTRQAGYSSKMPDIFWDQVVPRILNGSLKVDLGLASTIRYSESGVNLNNYYLHEQGQTIAEYFGVGVDTSKMSEQEIDAIVQEQNKLIKEFLIGNIDKQYATDYINSLVDIGLAASDIEINNINSVKKAKQNLIKYSKSGETKGMSTFDFDETLIIGGENFVVATDPESGNTVQISSEEWPIKGPEYSAAGYQFDFSDFANVRGGKEGPLLQKMKNQVAKYGNENVFVLTARQQASAVPIQEWLRTQGIDIPLKNITGLGKSEGEAKAQWMLEKFAEGYNDMYFVDDAMPNVRAVKQVLDALDIKSKVVQAKVKFSRDGSAEFNRMLERNTGVSRDKIFSEALAKRRGAKADKFRFFVPPSAEDFKGLIYNFLGKGRQGDADMQFFKEHLLDPFTKGIRDINFAKQRISEEFKTLRKQNEDIVKSFNKKVAGTDYTVNDALRVYLWNKNDIAIPGLSEQETSLLSDYVSSDPKTKAFADALGVISRASDGYVTPGENWVAGSIASDLYDQSGKVNRAEYLSEWIENKNTVFSPENMNKIEAVYGTEFRDALDNMLMRMETGNNRAVGGDKTVNKFMDWINGSVGAVMFFNTRSAALQTLSTINFINWSDNNIFKASKAFANQPQYWKDFLTLFNSDMLKQRRAGMQIDVNLAELSNAVAKSSMAGKAKAAVRYLLQIGFTPTQIADSFAIASGGSTFYRNKINKYVKQGLSKKEAETKAFEDFQEIAEETQQSSRPDLISQQQAGTLGRLILAWQNTPMQYTRLTKKAISDLVNGRGDWKSHVSRILYYGAMQNVIFGALQTGLAFLLFGADDDDEKTQKRVTRVANGALDTLLRGTGVYGAMASTLKNTIMKYAEEKDKPYGKQELSKVGIEAIQLSPPIGSKIRKIMAAIYSYEYNEGVPEKMGLSIDNPALDVVGNLFEATTNVPIARTVRKAQHVEEAISGNHDTWKRVALLMGWSKWDLDIKDEELEEAKAKVKQEKQAESKAKSEENRRKKAEARKNRKDGDDLDGDGLKEYRCKANTRGGKGPRCKNITENKNKKCYAHQ